MQNNSQKEENNLDAKEIKKISEISVSVPSSDSQKKQVQSPPQDIFADSETTTDTNPPNIPKPNIFKPVSPEKSPLQNNNIQDHEDQADKNKKLFFLLLIIIFVLLLILAGIWGFKYLIAKPASLEQKDFINQDLYQGDNKIEEKLEIENSQELQEQDNKEYFEEEIEEIKKEDNIIKDTDNDGLSDDEEINLGTNINKTDSDSDKLFDREEVYVYKTDPLNPDTDQDGFLDGEEVLKGYNPLGSGKLYDIE